jgi:hypothetical protein
MKTLIKAGAMLAIIAGLGLATASAAFTGAANVALGVALQERQP